MLIGGIDLEKRPMLIAEIGNNHEGDPGLAVELVEAAVEAGADAVKVQIIDPPRLMNIAQKDRVAQLGRFGLAPEVFDDMAQRVRRRGRLFMASVFDCESLARVQNGLDAIKIASGDLDFDPMLELAARSGKPIVLSTGMSRMDEIERAVGIMAAALPAGVLIAERLAVLHCVSLYPTPPEQANLRAIPHLRDRLGVTVGYSDHTLGLDAALMALALGARVIEKHFTLDRHYSDFRDHALSSKPDELARLTQAMRSVDAMLGTGARDGDLPDAATRSAARRSIVAAADLPAGKMLQAGDFDYVRPAGGLPPSAAATLAGRRLRVAVPQHGALRLEDIE